MFTTEKITILDGSTGKNMIKAGMPAGVSPERWILDNPDKLTALQRSFVDAGSDAVYAPTFGANRLELEKHGLAGELACMNAGLVALSKQAVGGRALVGGDMTALGLFLKPYGEYCFDDLFDVYAEQAAALEAAGVDFFAVETMMSLAEARAAVLAVRSVSQKPIICTMTFEQSGKTLYGTDPVAALVTLQAMGVSAFGVNCSTGPSLVLSVLEKLAPYAKISLVAKPNAGVPAVDENGNAVYKMTPAEFASYTERFASLGVRLMGGCCGTDASHIAALKKSVDSLTVAPFSPSAVQAAANERSAFFDFKNHTVCELNRYEDAAAFEEEQYFTDGAVCFRANDADVLERALRVYNGRALFDKAGHGDKTIERLAGMYGAIAI